MTLSMRLLVVATLAVLAQGLSAQQEKAPASTTDLTGEWVMNIESHQMGLELEQDGTKVQGVLHAMGGRQLLVGTFIDGTLTLKGEKPEGGADDPPPAAGGAGPIVAKLLDNGTLEGELSTNHGRMKWTGERFKKP